MSNKKIGYIYLHKSLLHNPIWDSNEKFGLRDAWIDLLLKANYKDSQVMSRSGDVITVRKGQLLTSQANLAKRWGWSKSKVHRVLRNLKNAEMIDFEPIRWDKGGTLITLLNYSYYQSPSDFAKSKRNANETRTERERNASDNHLNKYNEITNEINEEGGGIEWE